HSRRCRLRPSLCVSKGEAAMIDRARKGLRSGFADIAGRLVLRSLLTSTFLLAAAIALSATSPSWADRVWADAAAVKASILRAPYRHAWVGDVEPDGYVQGLRKLGIVPPRS